MKIGISTKCFGGIPTEEAVKKISDFGYEAVELCLCQQDIPHWQYNAVGKASVPSEEEFLRVCKIYDDAGLKIASLGTYRNLWCGSDSDTYKARKSFAEYLDLARIAGIDTVSCELGFASGSRSIRGTAMHHYNYSEKEQKLLTEAMLFAAFEAYRRGMTIAVEPNRLDPFKAPEEYLAFADGIEKAIGTSDVIKFTLSPHIFENAYSPNDFKRFSGRTAMIHVKEIERDGSFFCSAGKGFPHWKEFLSLIEADYAIVEYADDRNAGIVRSFIEARL